MASVVVGDGLLLWQCLSALAAKNVAHHCVAFQSEPMDEKYLGLAHYESSVRIMYTYFVVVSSTNLPPNTFVPLVYIVIIYIIIVFYLIYY